MNVLKLQKIKGKPLVQLSVMPVPGLCKSLLGSSILLQRKVEGLGGMLESLGNTAASAIANLGQ